MKAIEIRNNEALEKQSACGISEKVRMSKKRRARIDKINRDSSLSKFEKERQIDQLEEEVTNTRI